MRHRRRGQVHHTGRLHVTAWGFTVFSINVPLGDVIACKYTWKGREEIDSQGVVRATPPSVALVRIIGGVEKRMHQ